MPGTVAIVLTIGTYVAQRGLLDSALRSTSQRRELTIWSILTTMALTIGHFVYTPSTAFFLVLAAIHVLHGPVSSRSRKVALLELGVYVLSCLLYLVVQREIIFPWASRALAYGSFWTDSQYSFGVSLVPGQRSLEFVHDAARVSFNAWNAFSSFDAAWIVAPVIAVALLRGTFSRADRERRRHAVFVLGFFVVCFSLSIAPALLSDFRWTGYRILVGPVLLVCVAFLWAVFSMLPQLASAASGLRDRLLLRISSGLLAGVAFVTMATAVHEARAEVECLQHFVLRGPRIDSLLLLGEESGGGRSQLSQEFGYRIREAGPVREFGSQVIEDLLRGGQLVPAKAPLLGNLREVSLEDAARLRSALRTAVLNVNARTCSCVAGLPCQEMQASAP